ncbi:hypothetical protein [Aneurinibacillus soli]|nr:hypothetical protein [Aneurinibacillus soli]
MVVYVLWDSRQRETRLSGNGLQEYEPVFVLGTLVGNVLARHGV